MEVLTSLPIQLQKKFKSHSRKRHETQKCKRMHLSDSIEVTLVPEIHITIIEVRFKTKNLSQCVSFSNKKLELKLRICPYLIAEKVIAVSCTAE